jgi:excisionase family DNA binding protein
MKFILTHRFNWISSLSPSALALDISIVRDQIRTEANPKMVTREYFKVSELAEYSGISERTLWNLLKDPVNPIPHFRVGSVGRIVRVKRSEFDQWMQKQRKSKIDWVDQFVDEILN